MIGKGLSKISQSVRIGRKLLAYKFFKKRFPFMVNLLLTNLCNLKCFYCYPQVVNRRLKDIDADKWLEIIDDLHRMGTEVIVLLGGEPLLYKGIDNIVDRIKKHGMICELITNGYNLEKNIDIIKRIDSICISLDGDEATNDLNRGKGSFQKAVAAIKLATSNGVKTRIKAVITKRNPAVLDFLCRFAKDQGVVLTFTLPSIHTQSEDLTLDVRQIKELLDSAINYKKSGFPVGHTVTSLELMKQWPYGYYSWIDKETGRKTKRILPCIRNDLTCYIDADGMMYPCAILWSDFCGKNILEVGVKEAWENLKNVPCYSCGYVGEMEINLLLSLSLRNLMEAGRYYFKE